mmetsp:Transcript_94466/g.262844  ORF Transcript_94466/g.262844 Transcript_94466/m.262844 type:complete len:256 (-) Transcript_94466:488-1255(-)
MVSVLVAFSSCLLSVALAMALSSSATAPESSAISSVSFAIEASSSSISACRVSTASVFSFRVCSFVASSVSHQPLCSASSLASSISRTRRSLIIFLTLTKGSSAMRPAAAESTRLSSVRARPSRKRAARSCAPLCISDRSAASEEPPWSRVGRYFPALPETSSLEMISMALVMAASSSARRACRDSKSVAFFSHVAVRSLRYFSSASFVVVVPLRSASASALACSFLARVPDFSRLSSSACSVCARRSCESISNA